MNHSQGGNPYANPQQMIEMQRMQMSHGAENSEGSTDSKDRFEQHKGAPVSHVPSEVRSGFVRKVYTILIAMLFVTTVVAAPFQLLPDTWIINNGAVLMGLVYGSLFITVAMTCCCMSVLQQYPLNYVFIFVFSILYGIIVGGISMSYTLPSVLMAAGITFGIFAMLTVYACITKHDFTGAGPYLMVALFGLIVFGFVAMIVGLFFPEAGMWMQLIYAFIGAVLFSFYIVYDTQLILGGNHKKHQFSIDDYAFAALNLYLDIINLFLMILSLMGDRK